MEYIKHIRTFNNSLDYIREKGENKLDKVSVSLISDISRLRITSKIPNHYEMVDLGLPSGLKWAKCNLGASKEWEYGDYYMFGSTLPDSNNVCDWSHCPFNNGSSDFDEDYFLPHKDEWFDGNILKPEYDAATQIMGKGWRMPTEADFQELIDNTDNEWLAEDYVYAFGKRGDHENYIVFPVSGYRLGSSVYDVGSYGVVWSSSLNSSSLGNAWGLSFSSSNILVDNTYRYGGGSVRGVYDENII